jgi:hypothetical protein
VESQAPSSAFIGVHEDGVSFFLWWLPSIEELLPESFLSCSVTPFLWPLIGWLVFYFLIWTHWARCQWLMSMILATHEAAIRRIMV